MNASRASWRATSRVGKELKALVAGSIGKLGSHYAIALEAVNAESGDVMAREQVEAESTEQVLTVLGQATSRLREKLGESLASIQRFDVPLPRATTAVARSAACLRARASAMAASSRDWRRFRICSARSRSTRISRWLTRCWRRCIGTPVGQRKPRRFRNAPSSSAIGSASARRYFISWRYYMDTAQAWDKALELSTSWTKTYPREAFAFNSLGLATASFGQHERAVDGVPRSDAARSPLRSAVRQHRADR